MNKTCADCIHEKLCQEFEQALEEDAIGMTWNSSKKACNSFADKSRFIELPCAVGDTVYVPWHWDGTQGIATVEVEEVKVYDNVNKRCMFFIDMQSDDEDFNQAYGCWKLEQSIGKTVFLTKEDAEKALKGGAE
jgi:hypothetical protein